MTSRAIPFYHSLRGRMLLFVVLPTLVIFGSLIVFRAVSSMRVVRTHMEQSMRYLADQIAAEVERANARAVLAAQAMAFAQEEGLFGQRAESSAYARRMLEQFPEFTGAYFGYEPNADGQDGAYTNSPAAREIGAAFDPAGRYIPYWFRNDQADGAIELTPLIDMETSLYYQGCKDQFLTNNRALPMVTEPYVYEGKMIMEQTYPIVIGGQFKGVAGVDRALHDIALSLEQLKQEHRVDVILISSRGKVIASTLGLGMRTKALAETPYADLFGRFYAGRARPAFEVATDPVNGQLQYFTTAPVPTGDWLVVLRESERNVLGPMRANIVQSASIALGALLVVAWLGWWFSGSASRRIRMAMTAADHVATGDLAVELGQETSARDEIGSLFRSFDQAVTSTRQVSEVCSAIAAGDFSRRVTKRGEHDSLAESINLMAERRQAAEEDVRQYTAQLEARSTELERLGNEAQERATVESSLSALNASLRGNLTPTQVAERGLAALIDFLRAPMGGLFVALPDGRLHRMAAHAYPERADGPASYAPGRGVVGEVARSGRPVVSEPGSEALRVAFGFGAVAPATVLTCPLLANEKVAGVAEVCLFQPLTQLQQRWLEKASITIANAIRFALETEERQEAEERNRLLLESTAEGIYGVDTEGRVRFVNPAACRMLGYAVEELIDQPSHALIHHHRPDGSPYPVEECPMYAAYAQGKASRIDDEVLFRKDGTSVPVEYGATPVRKDGEIVGAVISFTDITERRAAQEELRLAKEKAEEATEMKSMFLANMSHEIRTPMNAIIGLAHLALKTDLNPKQRDYVAKVHQAGASLLNVINDILDVSKIEANRLDLETIDFKLDQVIQSVTTLTAQKAHEKGLEFLVEVPPSFPQGLRGDPLRLGQVITNLVNNAIKFTERGEVRVKAEVLEELPDGYHLQFSVRDTGMGMTPEQAGRLFQPFTQADMSTTRKHGGTGLGLTICKRLVEMMGGEIQLESEPGHGSTFRFTVRLQRGAGHAPDRVYPRELQRLRALVVDDNPAAREILADSLSGVASHVDAVASGPEALAALREHDARDPYDVVFMDWRMPGMDGLQTTQRIKQDPGIRHQPAVVIVTAFGREEVRNEAEALRVDGFLVKPVTRSMLVDSLVNVFAPAGGTAPVRQDDDAALGAGLRGARILLTEDNEINQQIAVELLEGVGAAVDIAANGRIAVEKLAEYPPEYDLVLMDLQMPEMDGYQATRKIRSDPRLNNLPIIAMTAHATVEERDRCLAAGMNDHVPKPIDPAHLYATLSRHFRPPAAAGTAGSSATPAGNPAPTPRAATPKDDLPSLEGLDTADGLRRVAGNRKLYQKLLRQFVQDQADLPQQIAEQLHHGDRAVATRLAHTLKGVAGNIGAPGVQTAAAELERALRDNRSAAEVETLRRQTATALETLVTGLRDTLGPDPATAAASPDPSVPVDPVEAREARATLLSLLAESDPAAGDCLEAHRAALRSLFPPAAWTTFEAAIQNYEFSAALEQLRATAPGEA